jgi:ectoine hydroxylase-related dioxygenase (phytanoyl-CoA dioxygenase family)
MERVEPGGQTDAGSGRFSALRDGCEVSVALASGDLVSDVMVSYYRREGYVKLPAVLDGDTLEALRDICVATESHTGDGLVGQRAVAPAVAERFAYQADARYRAMWSNSFDLRLRFELVSALVDQLADVARTLLGESDVRVFWDKTFVKPPKTEGTRESVWHQDFPYNPIDRRGMLTVWVALEDVPAESGALRFVPGSHHLGPLGRLDLVNEEYDLDDILRQDDRALVREPVTVPLLAGQATVHDALTLHGAGPNLSDRARRAWSVVFLPGSTRYTGGPHPHDNINSLGLEPFEPFDHPIFKVSSNAV